MTPAPEMKLRMRVWLRKDRTNRPRGKVLLWPLPPPWYPFSWRDLHPRDNVSGQRRMHGGVASSGAPKGKRNGKYRHGVFTTEAIEERRRLASLIRHSRDFLSQLR